MAGDPRYPDARRPRIEPAESVEEILPVLRHIARRPGRRGTYYCETGYGMVGSGDAVLIAVNNFHDSLVVEGVRTVLQEKGAKVDVITYDVGEDRQRAIGDEVGIAITGLEGSDLEDTDLKLGTFQPKYGEYLGLFESAEAFAEANGYDCLIQSQAGPLGEAHETGEPYALERIPWQTSEILKSAATTFPAEVSTAINESTFDRVWREGAGGQVHITDPEGTDLTFTLWDEYVENAGPGVYRKGHIALHPYPPVAPSENSDMSGVISGTFAHYNAPFPHITYHVEDGRVDRVEGGGEYGDQVRTLVEETADVQYPNYPGTGLFWPIEFAVGTNPKAFRPERNFLRHSGTGTLAERLRSGIIHVGIGSPPIKVPAWAEEQGVPYGHVHVHLHFPTVEITTPEGETVSVIEDGRLSALDDPGVREAAEAHADPDELLAEDWIPVIPGVSADGDYGEYAEDPLPYLLDRGYVGSGDETPRGA